MKPFTKVLLTTFIVSASILGCQQPSNPLAPIKVKITSTPGSGDGSSGDFKGDEGTSTNRSSSGNSFDKEYEVDHSAHDNLLVVLPDGSTLSADPNQMKSSEKLLLIKRDANGKVDPSFQPDPIAFFTSPFFASWHEIRRITPLRNNSYLLTTLSGYNGAGAFRYMHIFKINEAGKIDRKFGTKGTVAFEADSTGLNYRFIRYLVERTDGKLVGLEHRCVPEGSSSYGQCERFFFRLTKDGKIDRTFGKNGFAAVDSYNTTWQTAPSGQVFLSENGIGILDYVKTFPENEITFRMSHYSLNGALVRQFGTDGVKKMEILEENCKLMQISQANKSSFIAIQNCPKTQNLKVSRIDQDGEMDKTFGASNGGIVEIPMGGSSGEQVEVAGFTTLNDKGFLIQTAYSISAGSNSDPHYILHRISVLFLNKDGASTSWEPETFVLPPEWHINYGKNYYSPVIFSGVDSQQRIVLNITRDNDGSSNDGLWLRTNAISN